MAGSHLKNEAEVRQWILRRLGAPQLEVQLTECNLDDALEDARRWFTAKKGVKRIITIPFHSGEPQYKLPDDVDTVLDVSPPVSPYDMALIFAPYLLADETIPYDVYAAPSSGGVYSSYAQSVQYIEQAKRVIGAEFEWRQEGQYLWLLPTPHSSGMVWVDYKGHCLTIEQLNERDHDLVKRRALAYAKRDLGRVRSKYDSYPSAQGSVTLDGPALLAEAEAELEKLDEEIADSGFPIGFVTG